MIFMEPAKAKNWLEDNIREISGCKIFMGDKSALNLLQFNDYVAASLEMYQLNAGSILYMGNTFFMLDQKMIFPYGTTVGLSILVEPGSVYIFDSVSKKFSPYSLLNMKNVVMGVSLDLVYLPNLTMYFGYREACQL